MTDTKNLLQKIASKENARAAAEVALSLFLSEDSDAVKKSKLTAFIIQNAEQLDDAVTLIPGYGPVIHALVDSPAVDQVEAQLADLLAETVVQALKGTGN